MLAGMGGPSSQRVASRRRARDITWRPLIYVTLAVLAGAAVGVGVSTGVTRANAAAQGSSLQAWGDNSDGEIGHGPRTGEPVRSPVAVEGISCAVAAAVTFHDSYAVLGDGHVDAWGSDNAQGGLGDGDPGFQEYSYKPVEATGISNAVQIAAEIPDTYVLLSDGTVDAWGDSADGAFGLGASGPSSTDLPVTGIGHLSEVSQIATGDDAQLALLSDGEVRSWGSNTDGQLGDDTEDTAEEPVTVGNENDTEPLEHVKAVAEGVGYSLALMADGEVMAWGGSPTSGLGAGNLKTESELPVTVEDVAGDGNPLQHVIAIAAGASTAYALLEGGTVVAWGYDALGQLGDGKAEAVTAYHPVAVKSLKEVVEIAATEGDGYARLANGTVWAWGNNTQGEVGNGSETTPIPTPTQITGLGSTTTGLADGPQGQPELALGPISTECGTGTGSGSTEKTTTETKTETTPNNPNNGTAGTASSTGSSTSTGTTGKSSSPPPPSAAELAEKLATAFGLPSAKMCFSHRAFKIHIQQPPGYPKIVSA
jgi:alpha-tubulin suppressor-like RCC1 family protein